MPRSRCTDLLAVHMIQLQTEFGQIPNAQLSNAQLSNSSEIEKKVFYQCFISSVLPFDKT